ncbi:MULTISPECIES: type III-B CRISPR module-associated protein Cmr5 [Clostridia]|uniref:type III-B CRISPR module-associated protein Cmr5 n=1 Tax=Clostridia TaxID=186801 RepID=UPI000EA11DEC|nr:type III-B CRISPR module-associated protein Cmr5 [Clostridium sp. 1xD42-85]NBJ68370.1 type III-B CRISPR module-associated protein Cmr5 [Roseburia sp. 1XD42-34]RKI81458.1 type III-B CRISPR module-associated protein Cmr5 [Clostridium sp. 1xD42-85]
MKNIQNERAAFAYDKVNAISNKSFAKAFRSIARSTPARIQMTGLATTAAFLFAKNELAHQALFNMIHEWLKKRKIIENDQLMEAITGADLTTYRVMTNEIQQFLIWVKRFAEGMIDSEQK